MDLLICPACNNLQLDEDKTLLKSTSVGLLRSAANGGCPSCRIIYGGIQAFVDALDSFDVALSLNKDPRATLIVSVWTGLRMTRNPRRSKMPDHVAPLRLEFYTKPNQPSPWPVIAARPSLAVDSASETCFNRIEEWIKNCVDGHKDCEYSNLTALPSRLIDVGAADGTQMIKLVDTRGGKGAYFALSHCWGGNQPLKTTKATLRDRMAEIEWQSLPKTFQDAITITRKLKRQYIWIDSLCIVQDDNDDWEIEAANMGAIYEKSLLTISASIAANPTQGIFSHRPIPCELEVVGDDCQEHKVFVRELFSHDDLSTQATKGIDSKVPLLTRAWAYQERLLATRVLHYLHQELRWECRSAIRCECGIFMPGAKLRQHSKRGFSKVIQRNKQDPAKAAIEPWRWTVIELKMWPQIVAEYSARDLTFRKDRLPALSGVARRLQESNPSTQYLAGIWSNHLPSALLWRILKKHPNSKQHSDPVFGPLGRREAQGHAQTPSWSWTSIEGDAISISYPEQQLIEPKVKIITAETTPSGIDPFSLVKQGIIKLRGQVVAAVLSYEVNQGSRAGSVDYNLTNNGICRSIIPDAPLASEEDYEFLASGSTVYCLLLGSFGHTDTQALVLRRSRMIPEMYQRIGVLVFKDRVQTDTFGNSWFSKAEELEITLI